MHHPHVKGDTHSILKSCTNYSVVNEQKLPLKAVWVLYSSVRRSQEEKMAYFLAFFACLFSRVTNRFEPINIDEYVPKKIPTRSAREKCFVATGPTR